MVLLHYKKTPPIALFTQHNVVVNNVPNTVIQSLQTEL